MKILNDAESLLQLFENTDAFRRPGRFYKFLAAIPELSEDNHRLIIEILDKVKTRRLGGFERQLSPKEIQRILRAKRLNTIKQALYFTYWYCIYGNSRGYGTTRFFLTESEADDFMDNPVNGGIEKRNIRLPYIPSRHNEEYYKSINKT